MRGFFFLFHLAALLTGETLFSQTHLKGNLPCNTVLTYAGSPYIVDSTLAVLPGCTLKVEAGVEIRMANFAHMHLRGKAEFNGTPASPIRIHAKNNAWGIIFLDSIGETVKSYFRYVSIEDATEGPEGHLPDSTFQVAALSAYYSGLELHGCSFKNNRASLYAYRSKNILVKKCVFDSLSEGEKVLIQYSDFGIVDSSVFYFTGGLGDAIDFDASNNVVVTNNRFYGGDADAMDFGNRDTNGCSGVIVRGNYIYGMGDKGVSCGEKCTVQIDHNLLVGCDIGIVSKAASVVTSDHNTLYANRVGVKSYDKGDGWGVGHLTVTNCIISSSTDSTFVKDLVSYLSITWSLSDKELLQGTGNQAGDPKFIYPAADSTGDFHLTSASPAIDSGDPSYPLDPDSSRTDMGAFFFNKLMSIDPSSQTKFAVDLFPNPSGGNFRLRSGMAGNNSMQVNVIDTKGRFIYSEALPASPEINIRLNGLEKGIYFVEIITGDEKILVKKLVIN